MNDELEEMKKLLCHVLTCNYLSG